LVSFTACFMQLFSESFLLVPDTMTRHLVTRLDFLEVLKHCQRWGRGSQVTEWLHYHTRKSIADLLPPWHQWSFPDDVSQPLFFPFALPFISLESSLYSLPVLSNQRSYGMETGWWDNYVTREVNRKQSTLKVVVQSLREAIGWCG
jgi:hypothetical protein